MKSRATQTKELDMVNGPLARKILIYSIPLMFSNLLQVFFNMTDVAVVNSNPRIPFVTQDSLFVNENPVL